jgi:hypothetical protein
MNASSSRLRALAFVIKVSLALTVCFWVSTSFKLGEPVYSCLLELYPQGEKPGIFSMWFGLKKYLSLAGIALTVVSEAKAQCPDYTSYSRVCP